MSTRTYRVLVYDNFVSYVRRGRWSTDTINRPFAYLTYQGAGACIHLVEEASGPAAKREAVRRHLAAIQTGACRVRPAGEGIQA